MKITKLWRVEGSEMYPVFGTGEELCRLIKLKGYYASKFEAYKMVKENIINKQFINQ
jgi:hypothetical protein